MNEHIRKDYLEDILDSVITLIEGEIVKLELLLKEKKISPLEYQVQKVYHEGKIEALSALYVLV